MPSGTCATGHPHRPTTGSPRTPTNIIPRRPLSRPRSTDGIWITEIAPAGDGPRLAVKDLFDTAGIRTTYGSAAFRDHVPQRSAVAVTLLEDAGFVTVGKANLHEFAWGITSENDWYGWVPNPAFAGRIAGGSSGGNAAAIAAGLAKYALGSDSGGSIRIPSACCGTTGFKPTFDLVPIEGCWPLAKSYDTAGPMARDVDGCELMMEALVPAWQRESVELADLRIGVAWTEHADAEIAELVLAAAGRACAEPVAVPLPPGEAYPLFKREAVEVHEPMWREHPEVYSSNVAAKIENALEVTDADVERARAARERYREEIAQVFESLDLLLAPTLPTVPPQSGLGDLVLRGSLIKLTLPWNTIGAPALALPCGTTAEGLPVSIQVLGPPGNDELVLAAGRALG